MIPSYTQKDYEDYMLAKPGVTLDYPFGEEAAVYKVGGNDKDSKKMFAIIKEGSQPVNISLKCDPNLSKQLREQYESIMPGYHLNKKHWNTIIDSGQLGHQELLDLIDLSYRLVFDGLDAETKNALTSS